IRRNNHTRTRSRSGRPPIPRAWGMSKEIPEILLYGISIGILFFGYPYRGFDMYYTRGCLFGCIYKVEAIGNGKAGISQKTSKSDIADRLNLFLNILLRAKKLE